MTVFWCVFGVSAQMILWMAAARVHYRTWWDHDKYTSEDTITDHQVGSALLGFIWPALAVFFCIICICAPIGWAMTTPSVGERKQKKREAKQEKLRELNKQTKVAEEQLERATQQLERATRALE